MSQKPSPDTTVAINRDLFGLTRIERPKIKILLYTDAPLAVVEAPVGNFGLGRMIALLEAHAPAFAVPSIQLVSRSRPGSLHAENRIHDVLRREKETTEEPFDQVWFFGVHQVNNESLNLLFGGGGPESELDADEVKALRDWMDEGGGVLMTGDHANPLPRDVHEPNPNTPCPHPDGKLEFAGLGRALGRCVPRAGEMRNWDGPPTSREEDSNDTQVTPFVECGLSFEGQIFSQRDPIPQQLILPTFDVRGEPSHGGRPHPLFLYREGCGAIQFFPDHLHEGQVVIPKTSDEKLWRRNAADFQPQPRVVAYGIDKRNGNKINLLAAYDGHPVGVGRIVADSSWHHYFNINLTGFTEPTVPGSPIDQIGQFYANLALWLSPPAKRFRMAEAMFRWLSQDPVVMEEIVPSPDASVSDKLRAGVTARRLLSRVSSSCELHELLHMIIPQRYAEQFETLHLPEKGYNLSVLPSKEMMLGCVINWYPPELLNGAGASPTGAGQQEKVRAAFEAGCADAFKAQEAKLKETANLAGYLLTEVQNYAANPPGGGPGQGLGASSTTEGTSERSSVMSVCEITSWEVELIKSDSSSATNFTFINMEFDGERLKGDVLLDLISRETVPLTGTCVPFVGPTNPLELSLMSFQFVVPSTRRDPAGLPILVEIFMGGVGFRVPNGTLRDGFFRTMYSAYLASTAAVSSIQTMLAVDAGDTGVGNGNQT